MCVIVIFGAQGFATGFLIGISLKEFVSRERILALDDLSKLYPQGEPPGKILSEEDRKNWVVWN